MNFNRRTFVKTGALAVAGTAFLGSSFCTSQRKNAVTGLQLYSIRDDMKRDPLGSLAQLAKMGYRHVEHASYTDRKFYGYSPTEFKKILDGEGLSMVSGHVEFVRSDWDADKGDFSDRWKYTVEDASVCGQKYVVTPWLEESIRRNYDDFMTFMDVFNKCGELCNKWGMKFGYHNHDFEFSEKFNGESLFDIMMRSFDPKLVVVQLDTGNLFNGGAVAKDVADRYPGRFEFVHLKDVISTGEEGRFESTIVGEGLADVREVLAMIEESGGARVIIIEQEAYQDKTPMECARINLKQIGEWGYHAIS
ncbi:MAG: sugar phosphate isomerase/epimerase family protein [Bacteroidales bacterium]|jgi:sugar phosphate isomerase/epimerase|nr:sugar phosphate isomerase/epimerase family protein [Bacteroidales bacterium]